MSIYPVEIIQIDNIPGQFLGESFSNDDSDPFVHGFDEPTARRIDSEFLDRFHGNLTSRLADPSEDEEKLGLSILKFYAVRDAFADANPGYVSEKATETPGGDLGVFDFVKIVGGKESRFLFDLLVEKFLLQIGFSWWPFEKPLDVFTGCRSDQKRRRRSSLALAPTPPNHYPPFPTTKGAAVTNHSPGRYTHHADARRDDMVATNHPLNSRADRVRGGMSHPLLRSSGRSGSQKVCRSRSFHPVPNRGER